MEGIHGIINSLMVLHVKGFSMLFISISMVVSITGLNLNIKCALYNSYGDRAKDCLELILGQLILTVQEGGNFRNIYFYACQVASRGAPVRFEILL